MPDSDIFDLIGEYASSGALPMHMPGHKRNAAMAPYLEKLGAAYDITEIDGFDNLHDAGGALRGAMLRASRLWGCRRSFFLVNGSTCGILAAVCAHAKRGDKVIAARNCHMSVYNALELSGAEPFFVAPPYERELGLHASLRPEDAEIALRRNPDAKLMILTSPTYEGVISDVESICRAAHSRGIPVLVDEAHGAHLGFSDYFGGGAVRAGADVVIQSLHKTLPSLTQTAIAHLSGSLADEKEFARMLSVFETSSPSYLLMSSIDACVGLLDSEGGKLFERWERSLLQFGERIRTLQRLSVPYHGDENPQNRSAIFGFDRSKILISTRNASMSGAELMRLLRGERKIELEMSSGTLALAMTGLGDTPETLSRLADALLAADSRCLAEKKPRCAPPAPLTPRPVCGIQAALHSVKTVIPLDDAAGRVSAEYVFAYPPGVPLLIPGEEISEELVGSLRSFEEYGTRLKSSSGNLPSGLCVMR